MGGRRAVDCIFSREFEGQIKTTTVSRTPTGKYLVSILVDIPIRAAKPKPVNPVTAVGLDRPATRLGIKTFLVTSQGEEFENRAADRQKFLSRNLKRLRVEQRSLTRKQKAGPPGGSTNREKQRMVVAKLHEKIRNQRNDYLHKISTQLVNQYDTICMEDLNVKGMVKTGSPGDHCLARAIGEQGWSDFKHMCEYKCETYGKHFIQIGRFQPSSKMCSVCGMTNHQLTLKDRQWTCHSCSTIHDRDVNAAINIKDFGCSRVHGGSAPRGGRLCPLTWSNSSCVGQESPAALARRVSIVVGYRFKGLQVSGCIRCNL